MKTLIAIAMVTLMLGVSGYISGMTPGEVDIGSMVSHYNIEKEFGMIMPAQVQKHEVQEMDFIYVLNDASELSAKNESLFVQPVNYLGAYDLYGATDKAVNITYRQINGNDLRLYIYQTSFRPGFVYRC